MFKTLGIIIILLLFSLSIAPEKQRIELAQFQLISGEYYFPKKIGLDFAFINNEIVKLPKNFDWEEAANGFFLDKKGNVYYGDEKSISESED